MRRDPEKLRAWQERSRAKAAENAQGRPRAALKRSSGLARGKTPPKPRKAGERPVAREPVGPLRPGEWRDAVWELDGGRCVACGRVVPKDADRWVWQAHHPLPKQKLPAGQRYDPRNGVVLCTRDHERHETRTAVIAGTKLPARVREFAAELGDWAVDALDRAHPIPAAGSSGSPDNGRQ